MVCAALGRGVYGYLIEFVVLSVVVVLIYAGLKVRKMKKLHNMQNEVAKRSYEKKHGVSLTFGRKGKEHE